MTRNRLYLLLGTATLAGYVYLVWAANQQHEEPDGFTPCLFKNISGIPCPSCGSTRSVLSLLKGDVGHAIFVNPLGILIAAIMLILPLWLVYDILTKGNTLYTSYTTLEKTLRNKIIAVILITLIIANWIWNIYKQV